MLAFWLQSEVTAVDAVHIGGASPVCDIAHVEAHIPGEPFRLGPFARPRPRARLVRRQASSAWELVGRLVLAWLRCLNWQPVGGRPGNPHPNRCGRPFAESRQPALGGQRCAVRFHPVQLCAVTVAGHVR